MSKENGKPGRKREEELMLARKWEGECRVGCTSELCPSVMGGADMMSELDLLKDCAQGHGPQRGGAVVSGERAVSPECRWKAPESSWSCVPPSKTDLRTH